MSNGEQERAAARDEGGSGEAVATPTPGQEVVRELEMILAGDLAECAAAIADGDEDAAVADLESAIARLRRLAARVRRAG